MRIRLLLLLFILLMPVVFAEVECSKVFVVKFNYDNGIITYRDRVIKCGYAPDRRIQPVEGYRAEIICIDNEVGDSFKFEIPLELNFDLSDPIVKSLSGGILILNETDFALIFPDCEDGAKSIVIYNPRDYEIVKIPLIEEQFIQKKSFWWLFILIILILTASYIIYKYYKPKRTTKNL